MKNLKRLFLYSSISVAYFSLKCDYFYTWGYWVALILLILWYFLDIADEHKND